jgi:hypothetical protein
MLALALTLAFVPSVVHAAPCDVDAAESKAIAAVAPALVKQSPLPEKWWKGLRATNVTETLEIDERVVRFVLVGDKAPAGARLSLALPAPWSGAVDVTPRAGGGAAKFCAQVELVLFDKDLRRATIEGLPVDVSVSFARKGGPIPPGLAAAQKKRAIAHERLVLAPDTIDAVVEGSEPVRLWIGAGPPDEEALLVDGADTYMKFLAGLGSALVDDVRNNPSRDAQRVLFAEAAASWRADLGAWLPRKRIDAIARFDEKAIPAEARPLLRFWKQELSPSKIATGPNAAGVARLIVDDAVLALWIEGVEVFDRSKGMATSIELKPPKTAVRAWIVSRTPSGAASSEVVHDTRAVLRAGEIYAVTATFVQHARGGARRECVRVVGAVPFDKDLLWREISNAPSTRPGPMLGPDETYRPSVASAERALTVVPGGDTRPFPPVPLVYSYTHAGLYKWTLAKDGGVKLELVDDASLCPEK